eukprot:scaffold19768_cov128-Isochrysis_galbana.AAC.2
MGARARPVRRDVVCTLRREIEDRASARSAGREGTRRAGSGHCLRELGHLILSQTVNVGPIEARRWRR